MLKKNLRVSALLCAGVFVLSLGLCSSSVFADDDPQCEDFTCSKNKVLICHKPDNVTVYVDEEEKVYQYGMCKCVTNSAIDGHLGHGDHLGACVTSPSD